MKYKMLWVFSVEENSSIHFGDSFHIGVEDAGTFDTGLTRLFSIATMELEYNFATMIVAAV